jgi:predicted component of type VI protein secretion system
MFDYGAYVTAQRQVRDLATSALPGAPVRPDPEAPATHGRRLRRHAAQLLVRTAERLEPGAVAAHRA